MLVFVGKILSEAKMFGCIANVSMINENTMKTIFGKHFIHFSYCWARSNWHFVFHCVQGKRPKN